jgi:hypothetical protein
MPAGAGLVVGLTMKIAHSGIYKLHLIVDGEELKTLPLKVEVVPEKVKVIHAKDPN